MTGRYAGLQGSEEKQWRMKEGKMLVKKRDDEEEGDEGRWLSGGKR